MSAKPYAKAYAAYARRRFWIMFGSAYAEAYATAYAVYAPRGSRQGRPARRPIISGRHDKAHVKGVY